MYYMPFNDLYSFQAHNRYIYIPTYIHVLHMEIEIQADRLDMQAKGRN